MSSVSWVTLVVLVLACAVSVQCRVLNCIDKQGPVFKPSDTGLGDVFRYRCPLGDREFVAFSAGLPTPKSAQNEGPATYPLVIAIPDNTFKCHDPLASGTPNTAMIEDFFKQMQPSRHRFHIFVPCFKDTATGWSVDDVGFIDQLTYQANLEEFGFEVDNMKIGLTGFGAGAALAEYVFCVASERFDMLLSVAGNLMTTTVPQLSSSTDQLAKANGSNGIWRHNPARTKTCAEINTDNLKADAVIAKVNGLLDTEVPMFGCGVPLVWDDFFNWARRIRCQSIPVTEPAPACNVHTTITFTCSRRDSDMFPPSVTLHMFKDMDHTWRVKDGDSIANLMMKRLWIVKPTITSPFSKWLEWLRQLFSGKMDDDAASN